MQLVNHTPFPAMTFEARDRDDRPWHVLVVRATMTLDGGPRRLAQNQRPLVLGDTHVGEAATSSTLDESDLAPYKPGTDVLVRGTARPSDGVAARAWEAEVTVGARRSRVRVTGPRAWVRDADDRWRLTEPEPCDAVPMRYELAYGGSPRTDDRAERCEENPVGVGFAPRWWRDGKDRIAAPQLEWPDDPLTDIDAPIRPAGFGPVGRAWLPRRARAGTFDDAWLAERWPVMPADFHDAYWCSAPSGLGGAGYLRGDEAVRVRGMGRGGELAFSLPGHHLFALLRHESGVMLPFTMNLDTVTIDVDAKEVGLVWRLVTGVDPPIRLMEARMEFREPEGVHHG
jgi:hypothetical protein